MKMKDREEEGKFQSLVLHEFRIPYVLRRHNGLLWLNNFVLANFPI